MNQFTAARQIYTAKLPALYQKFQIKEGALTVKEDKITSENAFNEDHFRSEGNHE